MGTGKIYIVYCRATDISACFSPTLRYPLSTFYSCLFSFVLYVNIGVGTRSGREKRHWPIFGISRNKQQQEAFCHRSAAILLHRLVLFFFVILEGQGPDAAFRGFILFHIYPPL
jgi:hypothetical protein